MTDLSEVTPTMPPANKPSFDWLALSKYGAGAFVIVSMLGLVIAKMLPATDYEMLVVVPILGALGIHQARQAGSDIATKAAAQNVPTTTPPQA